MCECVCARGGKSVAAASLPSCWYTMVVVVVAVAVLTTRKQAERVNFIAELLKVNRRKIFCLPNTLKTLKLITAIIEDSFYLIVHLSMGAKTCLYDYNLA